jgi:hypothetical protein
VNKPAKFRQAIREHRMWFASALRVTAAAFVLGFGVPPALFIGGALAATPAAQSDQVVAQFNEAVGLVNARRFREALDRLNNLEDPIRARFGDGSALLANYFYLTGLATTNIGQPKEAIPFHERAPRQIARAREPTGRSKCKLAAAIS